MLNTEPVITPDSSDSCVAPLISNMAGSNSIVPVPNFGVVVSNSLYRSQFPGKANFGFLESLQLRTIIALVDGPYDDEYLSWMAERGIRYVTIVLAPNKEAVTMKQDNVLEALEILMDRTAHPVLVHCNKGKHRTGCVVACLRKIYGVDTDVALAEYRRYAGAKARPNDQVFIMNFNIKAGKKLVTIKAEDDMEMGVGRP